MIFGARAEELVAGRSANAVILSSSSYSCKLALIDVDIEKASSNDHTVAVMDCLVE
jgi:hypothetical protein